MYWVVMMEYTAHSHPYTNTHDEYPSEPAHVSIRYAKKQQCRTKRTPSTDSN